MAAYSKPPAQPLFHTLHFAVVGFVIESSQVNHSMQDQYPQFNGK